MSRAAFRGKARKQACVWAYPGEHEEEESEAVVVGDGLEREGRHRVAPRLRRRREDLHEVAHRDLVRRQLQQSPAGAARGRRVRRPRAAPDPREQAHGAAGDEGFEKFPLFFGSGTSGAWWRSGV